jgi:crotonobetainyl-CoA:carnitine CoA-transferase CaiB-like acyl-CoA transferase
MASKAMLTTAVISQSELYDGIRAGIVRLKDVLKALSYRATPEGPRSTKRKRWLPPSIPLIFQMVASPILIDGKRPPIKSPAPVVGQHTEEVLLELGYSLG